MNVRATVERLGREHVGKSWWADLSEALVAEFEPVVAERDRLRGVADEARGVLEAYDQADEMDWTGALVDTRLRAALDRGTP